MKKNKSQEAHVAAYFQTKEGILVARKRGGKKETWCLPHGKIELHETPQIALKRIAWEATGVVVDVEGLVNWIPSQVFRRRGEEVQRLTTIFTVSQSGGELNGKAKFLPIKELGNICLDRESVAILKEVRA